MRKLIVLTMVTALLVLAMPVLASEFEFGGDVTYGFITNFEKAPQFGEATTATFDVKATVDDYNDANVSIKRNSVTVSEEQDDGSFKDVDYNWIILEKATIVTDLGGAFGLADMGVGLELTSGYFDTGDKAYAVQSTYENEDVMGVGTATTWMLSTVFTAMDMVNLKFAVDPSHPFTGDLLVGVYAEVEPASFELFYDMNAQPKFDKGKIGVDGSFEMEMEDIDFAAGLGFKYDLGVDDAKTAEQWAYGVALAVDYAEMAHFDLGVNGNSKENSTLEKLSLFASVDPVELLQLYVGALLSFVKDTDTFQGADLGFKLNIGETDIYTGYVITENTIKFKAPDKLEKGGIYMKVDVNY